MYALVDCNNFFVSCERVFRPKLCDVPVCVLSFNDGCIVARSQQVKDLGVPMGAPLYKWEDVLAQHHTVVCSANFALYGDMSRRVMETLARFSPAIEYYSIDEAFLDFSDTGGAIPDLSVYCRTIRDTVLRDTGIPVSIGIGPTFTAAKAANSIAKTDPILDGICDAGLFDSLQQFLARVPIEKVWGVGRRLAPALRQYGITTAYDLTQASDHWIRRRFSVSLLRTVLELRGTPCCVLDSTSQQQTLFRSRGFGRRVTSLSDIRESLSTHISNAAQSLRKRHLAAWNLSVMLRPAVPTDAPTFFGTTLPVPTAHTPTLIHHAFSLLSVMVVPGIAYKKSGILLSGLIADDCLQSSFFDTPYDAQQRRLMDVVDDTNRSLGDRTLFFASSGTGRTWRGRSANRSQRFTTHFDDLLVARA